MESCGRLSSCQMFRVFSGKPSLAVWRGRYCEGQFADCERLKLALEGREIPAGLLPNGRMLRVAPEDAELDDTGWR